MRIAFFSSRLSGTVLCVLGLVAMIASEAAGQTQRQQAPARPARPPAATPAKPAAGPAVSDRLYPTIETIAKQAIIVDPTTGAVLLEKNADQIMPPSSMSKIMTAYVVFSRLREGSLSLTDTLPVSERAWRTGGSKMFVSVNTRVKVEDLLRGMIVQSGNDASVVLAEGLAGTEEAFAEVLTRKGREIGLRNSVFKNASGLPDPDHVMTARDLTVLAWRLIEDFAEYYHYDAELDFSYNGIKQGNRNPLLYRNLGVDGLKTGHTEAAGYGLTASAVRDGRRLIMVLNGLPSIRSRSEESERLLEWAFREFANYSLAKADATVETADVWLGKAATVPLVAPTDIMVTLPRRMRPQIKVSVVYDGPIAAPIAKGAEVARLVVSGPNLPAPMEHPLVAGADVGRLGFVGRVGNAAGYLLWGSVK